MREIDFDTLAILRAEGEGMIGAKRPLKRPKFDRIDEMALIRAENEGMYARPPQRKPIIPLKEQ